MEITYLKDAAFFVFGDNEKVRNTDLPNYISTENMLPDIDGVVLGGSRPLENSSVKRFKSGDILISKIRPYLRKIWLADIDGLCSNDVLVLRANSQAISEYIYYCLITDDFFNYATSTTQGTRMPRCNAASLLNYPIRLISDKNVQKDIVAPLVNLDRKIKLNKAINDNLEAMARQIYEFICTENKYSAINQKSFEKGTVSDIAEQIICGKTPSTKNQAFYGEEIPFITIPDMYNNTYVVSTERSLSILGKQSQDNKTLQQNSVCVSCIGTAGLVCLVSKTSQTNQQINSIIPKKGISPYFIYFTMKSLALNILSAGSSGSVMPNLSKSKFAELEVKIPDISEIEHFHSLVDPMFKKILSVQEENLILQNIKKQLNDLLINGQVSVNYHLSDD